MRISGLIYQAWHLGMLCLLFDWHFQSQDFANIEIYCLPLLFVMFIWGLIYYYFNHAKKNIIKHSRLYSIIFVEFIVFAIVEILIFILGWGVDSPPG